jgi:hypothetical protein
MQDMERNGLAPERDSAVSVFRLRSLDLCIMDAGQKTSEKTSICDKLYRFRQTPLFNSRSMMFDPGTRALPAGRAHRYQSAKD